MRARGKVSGVLPFRPASNLAASNQVFLKKAPTKVTTPKTNDRRKEGVLPRRAPGGPTSTFVSRGGPTSDQTICPAANRGWFCTLKKRLLVGERLSVINKKMSRGRVEAKKNESCRHPSTWKNILGHKRGAGFFPSAPGFSWRRSTAGGVETQQPIKATKRASRRGIQTILVA